LIGANNDIFLSVLDIALILFLTRMREKGSPDRNTGQD